LRLWRESGKIKIRKSRKSRSGEGRRAMAAESSTIGVVMGERIYAGIVRGNAVVGDPIHFPAGPPPADADDEMTLVELPAHALLDEICKLSAQLATQAGDVQAIGLALPGFLRNGVMEESPNLPQLKGEKIQANLEAGLRSSGVMVPVVVINDADGIAAGLASQHGKLDSHIRVWTLGAGIGYGRYPFLEGVWEGGHQVVSLDDRERFCGCGGRGHLEGIMGHRAMRLRFLDLEPEEVFAAANSIHFDGPGKFFLTGFNVRFIDMSMLKEYLHQMVKMSPLQSYSLEIVTDDHVTRVLGAGIVAGKLSE
jgi:glucokinase